MWRFGTNKTHEFTFPSCCAFSCRPSSLTAFAFNETLTKAGWRLCFASDIDTRKSMTGYMMVLNGGPVSWKASRQGGVTLSSSEADFVAASHAGQEVL